MSSPTSELFVRLLSDFTASLKHLKLVWKYDPFNTWAKEIMASFRTRYDTFILLWLLFSFFKYTQSIFSLRYISRFSLNYYYWWTLPKGNKDKVFMANTGTYTTTTITSDHNWASSEIFQNFLQHFYTMEIDNSAQFSILDGKYIYGNIKGR